MKIKLMTLLSAENALLVLLQSVVKRDIAFALAHNLRLVREALKPYNEFRLNLIRTKYGEKQDGGSMSIPPGTAAWAEFQKELQEFVGENELELDLKKVHFDRLPDEFIGAILFDLDWMIEFPEEKKDLRKRHKANKEEVGGTE
jgi:hypothetical protein